MREVAVGVHVSPLALLRHQYFVLVVITQFQETTESFFFYIYIDKYLIFRLKESQQ